jgi:hypothetical protein
MNYQELKLKWEKLKLVTKSEVRQTMGLLSRGVVSLEEAHSHLKHLSFVRSRQWQLDPCKAEAA